MCKLGVMISHRGTLETVKTAVFSAAAVLLLAWTGVADRSDRWWFDVLQSAAAKQAPIPANTALVLVDEQSLEALGKPPFGMRWPWPRAAFAAMLAGLHVAGANVIAVDMLFFESSSAAEQDRLLGAVAAGIPDVKLAAMPDRLPVIWPEPFREEYPALFAGGT